MEPFVVVTDAETEQVTAVSPIRPLPDSTLPYS